MASDDAQTRRAVEQAKLDRWCAAHHIEAASDLAFYFVTYEEALLEGRAVADGWEQARRERPKLVPLCGTFSVVNRSRRLRPGQLHRRL